ncbi:SH2 domain-containing protein A isoform X2 [Arachis hypogaea]|uniref:SH2 domain-containing protein A isoform X2 n=1 Tax=Arachis hypogaea TaxID=3818 RepID=UPI000DEC103C|nr:SH2 domain-containing protein A isoform X2 [Arachis hypogaea]QHO36908.1 Signal transducer and activator of transcription C [Arachis hypogaea]
MFTDAIGNAGYSLLKDLRAEIEVKDGTFSLCFWVYLANSTTFPATIIQQVCSDVSESAPFLVINDHKRINLLPLLLLHEEAPDTGNINSLTEVAYATVDFEFPLQNWVHIGCEVCPNHMKLQINGEIVGEKPLSSNKEPSSNDLRKIVLANIGGDGNISHGYVYNFQVFPSVSSIKDHHMKDPPLKLSIDESSASEIEEESDGVWSIVGGKASCRRNFSLDVVLLDVFGQPVDKENEVYASLLYADTRAPVENTIDEEAPILASYDGIEFPSYERPSKLLLGRASFKLKISQLSSKCDNRLFLIKFCVPKLGNYPFFEALSRPIRCISRSRNTRLSTLVWKRSPGLAKHNLIQSSGMDDASFEHQHPVCEAKSNPLTKRFRFGHDKISVSVKADTNVEQPDEECNSHARTTNQVENGLTTGLYGTPANYEAYETLSDSESIGERNSPSNNVASRRYPISDMTVFKYCLAGLAERSLMLKEIASLASKKEISELAHHVSLYSGCSHHRNQILIAKKLVEDGTNLWKVMSPNNNHVPWESAVYEIEEQFMKIASCSSRSLSHQDLELLRVIAGCQEYLAQENFEKLWCWLYPVAYIISKERINPIWNSTSPKWIEGFITKEEAEASLQGPTGLQEPGTFVLRFPTSRSWPHPDAGSLIVTYVGNDYKLHHRLLSVDRVFGSGDKGIDMKPLQAMLLEEPELTRLGRIIRGH